jgi:hypothetical protein
MGDLTVSIYLQNRYLSEKCSMVIMFEKLRQIQGTLGEQFRRDFDENPDENGDLFLIYVT